jgi:hypothetical protein
MYYHVYSPVTDIFLGFGIEEYSSVIFFNIKEYNKIEEYTMFSYSVGYSNMHKDFKCLDISSGRIHISIPPIYDAI